MVGIADLHAVPVLRDALMGAAEGTLSATPCRGLTVDLSRVDYIDSAGLSLLVAAAKALAPASGELRVRVAAGGQPDRALRLVRFDAIMTVISRR